MCNVGSNPVAGHFCAMAENMQTSADKFLPLTFPIRGGPFEIWGGGGLRKMYLNISFIFSQLGNKFFILPAVKNNFFF